MFACNVTYLVVLLNLLCDFFKLINLLMVVYMLFAFPLFPLGTFHCPLFVLLRKICAPVLPITLTPVPF